ncbi:AraC-like DNA-binding protein [Oxalobacteraceae bacterium GrIS 1.11]
MDNIHAGRQFGAILRAQRRMLLFAYAVRPAHCQAWKRSLFYLNWARVASSRARRGSAVAVRIGGVNTIQDKSMGILPVARSPEPPHFRPPEAESIIHYRERRHASARARWHCHDEYELHLNLSSAGKLFVGDYIGEFSPGHLVLTGPRLPHHWIAGGAPEDGAALREMTLQFAHDPIEQAARSIPELRELLPLLQRAAHGIAFPDVGAEAEEYFLRIRASHGLERFSHFLQFMCRLARSGNARLLSRVAMRSFDDTASLEQLNAVFDYIAEHYREPISAELLAERMGMSLSKFSRFFRKSTGNSFSDFVGCIRINKACQLLMNTDQYVSDVSQDVGFQNVANFNRRFLQVKGVTPKQFRRQAGGEA